MITIRRAEDRGRTKLDWLLSYHSFSFGTYHDPAHSGFGPLKIINEDRVATEGGFPTHPHRDMEILSYVLSGALEHKDSLGNHGIVKEGEIQLMTAGSGVTHSEFNPSETEQLHFLQIWIRPEQTGLKPNYQKRFFYERERVNRLQLVASNKREEKNALFIHQNCEIYISSLKEGQKIEHAVENHKTVWVQVVHGEILIGEIQLKSGDGVGLVHEPMLEISAKRDAEILVFVLPGD